MKCTKQFLAGALLAALVAGCGQMSSQPPTGAPSDTVPVSVLEEAQSRIASARAGLESERQQRRALEEQLSKLTLESDALIHQLMGEVEKGKKRLAEAEESASEKKEGVFPDEITFHTGTRIRCRVLGAADGILNVQLPTGETKQARFSSIAAARIRPEALAEGKVDEAWVAERAPAPAPVPAQPAAPTFRTDGLKLSTFWNIPVPASTQKTADLMRLFKEHGTAKQDLKPKPGAELYQGVYYLMPMAQAIEVLGLTGSATRQQVGTPGFPQKSLTYYEYKGSFDTRFDKLLLVTDLDSQVVAIQLVESQPTKVFLRSSLYESVDPSWHLFNLVENRGKGRSESGVRFKVSKVSPAILSVESEYVNSSRETRECTRLFLPQALVDLVLYLIETKYS